ncbi:MAG: sensor histidine kinase [Acidothermaceae bacterium]
MIGPDVREGLPAAWRRRFSAPKDQRALKWFRYDSSARPGARAGGKRWRRGGGIWLVYLLSPLGSAWTDHRFSASIAGTLLLIAFSATYLAVVPLVWSDKQRAVTPPVVVGVLLVLGLAATAVIGASGLTTLIFVVAAALVVFPSQISVPFAVVAAVVTTVVPQFIKPWNVHGMYWSVGVAIALASLVIFSYTSLIRANHELAVAREEVAKLATERERLRIARDLHDLLGHSLTTVTVKAALARRLVDADPERAKQEMAQVEELARESLADTRNAVAGYREVRLATELATAREVLTAAGIEADLPRVVDDVPADLGGLFGWAVREGVTNVVRHSRAERVRITVESRAIEIVDNGRGCAGGPAGHGLAGLSERASALGGTVVSGPAELNGAPHGFRLRVEVP